MKQRDIKFRVFDKDGDMRYGVWPVGNTVYDPNGGFWLHNVQAIMQWTGLLDRNGVEVYEGDIVEWWDSYGVSELGNDSFSTRAVVVFNDGGFDPVVGLIGVEIEVMGNIHQNPELLNETTN